MHNDSNCRVPSAGLECVFPSWGWLLVHPISRHGAASTSFSFPLGETALRIYLSSILLRWVRVPITSAQAGFRRLVCECWVWHRSSANKPLWICLFPSYTHTTVFAYQDAGRWMRAIRPFRQEEMMGLPGGHIKLALLAQLQRRWVEEQKLGVYLHRCSSFSSETKCLACRRWDIESPDCPRSPKL